MKAEVWCKSEGAKPGCLVWRGEIPFAPSEGQCIELYDFGSCERIVRATYGIESQTWCIEIGPDSTGECAQAAREHGLDPTGMTP